MRTLSALSALLLVTVASLLAGCSDDALPGCTQDADCRLGRVCVARVCQDPADNNGTNNGVGNNGVGNNGVGNNGVGNNGVNNGTNNGNNGNNGVNNGNNGVNNGNNGTNNGNNGNNGTNNGGPACDSDGDCNDDEYCESSEGSCFVGCREGGCDDDQYCELDSRECREGTGCQADADCPDGSWCESDAGMCLEGCREGECGEGARCEQDSRVCICETDLACPEGQYCEWDAGSCEDGCREGGCPDGQTCDSDARQCVGPACEVDEDCDENQYCDHSACLTGCREGGCEEGEMCDPDSRECVGEPIGPRIEVTPGAIDFGRVGVNNSAIQELTVRNAGDATLAVGELVLEDNPSQGFNIIAPSQEPLRFLAPGATEVYRIRMQPTFIPQGRDEVQYNNAVLVRSNDPESVQVRVALTGTATANPEVCLAFVPRAVDFGFVQPNHVEAHTVRLTNCGQHEATVTGIGLSDEIASVTLGIGGNFPRTLGPGDDLSLSVTYAPTNTQGFQTTLVARTVGDLEATSILTASGAPANGARIELSWDSGDDVDLHFIRAEDGEFSDPGVGNEVNPNDCYHANPNPDWGVQGDPGDDPFYGGDDDDFGPETTSIASFEDGARYLVVARFARNRAFGSPDLVLRVFSAGQVQTYETRLQEPGDVFAPVIIESDGSLTPTE